MSLFTDYVIVENLKELNLKGGLGQGFLSFDFKRINGNNNLRRKKAN